MYKNISPAGTNGDMMEEEKFYNESRDQIVSNKGASGSEQLSPDGEMPEEERFFKDFTNQDIDSKDPSLKGNNLLKIYEEEIPFEIRYEHQNLSENEKNVFQSLICKILTTDEMSEKIVVKIEIASDFDLFFYYTTEITSETFDKLKVEQKLTCNFEKFSDLFIKYLDLCVNDKKSYLAVLNIKADKKGNLELLENLEYKSVQLINIDFSPASKDLISKQISYRYNSLRAIENITDNKIEIINGVLKDCDPQLISEVKNEIEKNKLDNSPTNIKLNNNNK